MQVGVLIHSEADAVRCVQVELCRARVWDKGWAGALKLRRKTRAGFCPDPESFMRARDA